VEQAVPAYGAPSHPALAFFAGPDLGVFCRAYLSHLLWQFGHAEQAAAKSEESIALAREVSHPFTLAIALGYAAMLDVFRQEGKLALARAGEASAVCRKHGFAYYLAWAEILAGWATAVEGDTAGGLVQLRHGLDALKATGAELRLPFYYGLLAEACGLAGQVGEALANVASGFAFQSKNGEMWSAPELHRIHGDVLLHSGDAPQAQLSYRRAIESARQTGARLFELRAAARLRKLSKLRSGRQNTAQR
jgi:predicted ATPase